MAIVCPFFYFILLESVVSDNILIFTSSSLFASDASLSACSLSPSKFICVSLSLPNTHFFLFLNLDSFFFFLLPYSSPTPCLSCAPPTFIPFRVPGKTKMGKGGSLSESVVKKILLSYAYVAIWIFLSFTVIVYNKYILDKKMYNWPFPISLTMIHMSFCASLAFLLVRVFKVVEPVSMSRELYLSSVVPIGALYSLSLWFSNSAYIYLSVSFIQMLKALMPVAVYSIGVLFKKEGFKSDTMVNMISISFGVAIAAYGEARFDAWGVILQLGAVAFEATRLVLIQILLTSKGISLNPITSLYYVAPCCFVFLFIPWIFVEYPVLKETSSFHFDFAIFGTNSLCAFALNLAVFLLVGKTSALTMNVAGVVKDWLLIAFSWSVIKDTVTPINLFGYGIAFLGVAYYNHSKLQVLKAKEAQKKASQADEEAGRLLEEREGEGIGKRGESQD